MSTIRTPKAGETWVWLSCDKHEYKQLRDVVWCGVDFEDQPLHIQQMQIEHYICGCQYAADDPEAAIAALRRDERQHELEMRLKVAQIANAAYYPTPTEVSPWWAVAVCLAAMGAAMYLLLN